jgi:hypothetical protein
VTKNYATLFFEWKERTGSKAENMTFREVGARKPESGKRSVAAKAKK